MLNVKSFKCEKRSVDMSFARHETFYIRDGWLRKGIKLVNDEGFDFFKSEEAPEVLGMGKNMVNALRFWLIATGIVIPQDNNKNKFVASDFAKLIVNNDPYLEDEGTLWLIHYHLVTNKNYATTWYWFFNVFNHNEFDYETFMYWLKNYAITENHKIAESSLKKDFQCLINTYLYEKMLCKNNSPEDNLNCPLRNLKLIKRNGPKSYQLNRINRKSLHPLIFFFAVKRWQEINNKPPEITISNIVDEPENASKTFSLSFDDVIYYLEECQKLNLLHVSRTAGLDSVYLQSIDAQTCLNNYYNSKEVAANV